MPTFHIPPSLDLHYLVDDYTDPWRTPGTILLLHGNAESSAAWYAWVPCLAHRYRVVRPDMRGFGASTPMPRDFPWTLDSIIDDFCRLLDALGVERFHLVGAKIGGTIARAFAARRPERVRTLTVVGTPPPYRMLACPPSRRSSSSGASSTGHGRAWPAASGARFRRRAWLGGRPSWVAPPSRPKSVS
jgi:3-oxoadipate enol-lactonase